MEKVYLGDGAYISYDGYHIVLTTEHGTYTQNRICLDPKVLETFMSYLEEALNLKITVTKKEKQNDI